MAGSACLLAFDRPCGRDAGAWLRVEWALAWPAWAAAGLGRRVGRAARRAARAFAGRLVPDRRGFEVVIPPGANYSIGDNEGRTR